MQFIDIWPLDAEKFMPLCKHDVAMNLHFSLAVSSIFGELHVTVCQQFSLALVTQIHLGYEGWGGGRWLFIDCRMIW